MPLVLDREAEVSIEGRKDYSKGVPLALTPEQLDTVVLTKYISTDSQVADWEPGEVWFEQVTADIASPGRPSRITMEGLDGKQQGLTVDNGVILDLHATMNGVFGVIPGQPPMDEAAIDIYIDQGNDPPPTFQRWEFRLTRALLTDGPAAREAQMRNEDQKRSDSQSEMFEVFTQLFQQLTDGQKVANSQGELAPSMEAVMKEGAKIAAKKG